jgi:hypothetical protein
LAKAQKKVAATGDYNAQAAKRMNLFSKVRGLMIMLIGGTLVGFGMGGYDAFRASLFIGLEVLLLGFVWLAD